MPFRPFTTARFGTRMRRLVVFERGLLDRLAAAPAGKRLAGIVHFEKMHFMPKQRLSLTNGAGKINQRPVLQVIPIINGPRFTRRPFTALHVVGRHAPLRLPTVIGHQVHGRLGVVTETKTA